MTADIVPFFGERIPALKVFVLNVDEIDRRSTMTPAVRRILP